jgi:hypothetical protein
MWRLVRAMARVTTAKAARSGASFNPVVSSAHFITVLFRAPYRHPPIKAHVCQRLSGQYPGLVADPTDPASAHNAPDIRPENSSAGATCGCASASGDPIGKGCANTMVHFSQRRFAKAHFESAAWFSKTRRAAKCQSSLRAWKAAQAACFHTYSDRVKLYFAIFSFNVRRGRHSSSITATMLPLCRRIVLSISIRSKAST